MNRRSFLAVLSVLCVPLTGHSAPVPSGATASGRRYFHAVRVGDTFQWAGCRYVKIRHHDANVNAYMLDGPRSGQGVGMGPLVEID